MSIDPVWGQTYAPAEAERGKFIAIDSATLTSLGYPASGRGKYALLTYNIGAASGSSAGTATVPNTTIYATNGAILSNGVSSYNFGATVQTVEIFNMDSANTVYLSFNSTVASTISSVGLPIIAEGYYSIDRECQQVNIGNPNATSSDVRVIGHYRS